MVRGIGTHHRVPLALGEHARGCHARAGEVGLDPGVHDGGRPPGHIRAAQRRTGLVGGVEEARLGGQGQPVVLPVEQHDVDLDREARERASAGQPEGADDPELVDLFRSYYPTPRRAADILAAAGLTRLERRRAGQLSGGETQRLYFALALCGDPELLVLDEPTTSLDVQSRLQFWTIIGELAAKGTTILFATHLLEEADALATRIVVIDRGRILRQGTPAEVKAHAGGKTIRVRGDIDPEDVLLWPGVRGVERVGARYEIVATDAEAVLRRLFAGTAHVEEVTVEERALETAFLSLIKESN